MSLKLNIVLDSNKLRLKNSKFSTALTVLIFSKIDSNRNPPPRSECDFSSPALTYQLFAGASAVPLLLEDGVWRRKGLEKQLLLRLNMVPILLMVKEYRRRRQNRRGRPKVRRKANGRRRWSHCVRSARRRRWHRGGRRGSAVTGEMDKHSTAQIGGDN